MDVNGSGFGILTGDAPQGHTHAGADEFIGGHSAVDWIVAIERMDAEDLESHVSLLAAQEVERDSRQRNGRKFR